MTQSEILSLPNTWNEIKRLIHIHCEEGYVITDYFEDREMDIKGYCSTNCMFVPIHDEYSDYRVITVEEDAEYQRQAEDAREAEKNSISADEINEIISED